MLLWLALSTAGAAELHFELKTEDGVTAAWSKEPSDTFAKQYGPVYPEKKKAVVYLVNTAPSPYVVTDGGYRVEVSMCREWVKKKKKDRDCSTEKMVAPSELEGPATETTRVKGTDTFQYTLRAWYTGDPPAPPTPDPEPDMPEVEEPTGTVEVGE